MKVLCIEDFNNEYWSFYKDSYYDVVDIYYCDDYPNGFYTVQDEDGSLRNFSQTVFERYFFDIKRERMLKLKRLSSVVLDLKKEGK